MKTILISGTSSVGKTSLIKHLVPYLKHFSLSPFLCKIDCLESDDDIVYKKLNVPYMLGLSKDICPDHFLVSNLNNLISHSTKKSCDILLIETAGLCNRCSPATNKTFHICVCDCTSSFKTPAKLGPMLTHADIVVLSKIDMVSQAEREIISYNIKKINPTCDIFYLDGLVGYGSELIANHILSYDADNISEHLLRHTMPSGICSYCIGECRIADEFELGVVDKMDFKGEY
ncbi:MAG: cobalamin biosynthesis protein P47K [Epulopiscium sp. Nuni2H_MBin003]|nr:MAG: cobalamin biosynthesis protein P47K [Epulopiscium sp. Nuni2H_MBin003]